MAIPVATEGSTRARFAWTLLVRVGDRAGRHRPKLPTGFLSHAQRSRYFNSGDFMQQHFTERPVNANGIKSTVAMALANHETLFDAGVDASFSETSLHKVPCNTYSLSSSNNTARARGFNTGDFNNSETID